MCRNSSLGRSCDIDSAARKVFIIPAAQGWNLVRWMEQNAAWEVRGFATLEEAAPILTSNDEFVLALPISAVLVQRLRLPAAAEEDFAEMVRIQMEKTLPYAPEEVTTGFEVIEKIGEDSVVSAVAVHNEKLNELAAPLSARGLFPSRVTVYAALRCATHAPNGGAFLIFPEQGSVICAIGEGGAVSFARTLEGGDPKQLEMDLPHLVLSAELAGVSTSFPVVLLDESLFALRETAQRLLAREVDLIAVEAPPTDTQMNLLPEAWRHRRVELVRQAEWRRRLLLGAGVYAAIVLLLLAYLLVIRFEIGRLDRHIARDAPRTKFVQAAAMNWKALAPAIDPHYYPIEVLLHLFESLPSADVQITAFNQSARQISVDGEAKTAALVYQFADKVKKNAELQTFRFDMPSPPRILPSEHAQFRLEGKPR